MTRTPDRALPLRHRSPPVSYVPRVGEDELVRRRLGHVRTVVLGRHVLLVHCLEVVLAQEGYEVRSVLFPSPADPLPSPSFVLQARARTALLVVDLDAELDEAVRLVSGLAAEGTDVVVLTGTRARARWGRCLRHGAGAVIGMDEPLARVLDALALLSRGLPAIDRSTRDELVALAATHEHSLHGGRARLRLLTHRERTVLALLCEGLTVGEISRREVVAEGTVRTQVKSILAKLQVSSQLAAVALAKRAGG
ncbi:LuxR C-terminal-related transcriptional regulator [Nocardioides deserti]|uniref:Response regulator transcription factor n=1 Tax=Nocardioides deserti TaxID=1588644 RepID=A0ABR6U3R1_9ACTN|nr:LuxR C-terminal-related transcriptional regulator [Nocardioides deserti]MBC2959015.1 response regulator transcription factor [Nocardioides deserti]GGO68972.1 hypothetical protein GCM10012276_04050 [Nocardioides deserti]